MKTAGPDEPARILVETAKEIADHHKTKELSRPTGLATTTARISAIFK